LDGLGKEENQIILPKDLTDYDALIEGLSLEQLDEVENDSAKPSKT